MELQINTYLKTNTLAHSIDYFFQKLKTETLSPSDSATIIFFLQANNQKKQVCKWILQKIQTNSPFLFSHIFWLLNNQVDSETEAALLKGLKLTHSDCSTYPKTINSQKIQNLITQSLEKKKVARQQFKADLLEKIQHCKLNNLQGEYEKNIIILQNEFLETNNHEIKKVVNDFKEQNLENILTKTVQKYKNKKSQVKEKNLKIDPLYKKHLVQASTSLSEKNPHLSYDLSLLAQSFQLNDLSEQLLSNIETQSDNVLWLRAHNFIQESKFLEALNLIDNNLKKINSKNLLDYNYLKVFAWKGLGELEKAIAILDEILSIKKNYRSASVLKKIYLEEL